MTTGTDPLAPQCNVEDAVIMSASERLGLSFARVKVELAHRPLLSDRLYQAYDESVGDAVRLFCALTGTPAPKEDR